MKPLLNNWNLTVPTSLAVLAGTFLSYMHVSAAPDTRSFYPSPVTVENQWEYGRIAQSYPNPAGVYNLLAGNAEVIHGRESSSGKEALEYTLGKDVLFNWHREGDSVKWLLGPAEQNGRYDIVLHYGAGNECGENRFAVRINGQTTTGTVESTGGYQHIRSSTVGTIDLRAGQRGEVVLEARDIKRGGLFDFKAIELVPQRTPHRWFDVITGKWRNDVPPSMRFASGRIVDQSPPVHLVKDGPMGYAIITTKAIRDTSKVLPKFIEHKRGLGYTPMVITEDDFGGGHGPDAAQNIRNWLHRNYESKEILYVLLIGDPNPTHGEIPMVPLHSDIAEFKAEIAKGEHPHCGIPSDFPYADCSGASMDLDNDGVWGHNGDFAAGSGYDSVADVLVGRISYYGEDSAWGKVADVDAILQKTINYENATPEQIYERYNFEVDGLTMDGHLTEWAGFDMVTREQTGRGRLTLDHFSWQNNGFMDEYNLGFIRSGGHASPVWIESGVSSGWLANRAAPKDTLNVLAVYGGCDCSQPEHPMNMGYMHLRKGAIATTGASRSIASVGGYGGRVRPGTYESVRSSVIRRGYSVGQAHWQNFAKGQRIPNGGGKMWTLYGDPSVVPFPQMFAPDRQHALRPTHDLEHFESAYIPLNELTPHSQEYDIQNLSGKALQWSVRNSADWADLVGETSGTLQPGQTATVKLAFNRKSLQLPLGRSVAKLAFNLGDKQEFRSIHYVRTMPELTHQFDFSDKEDGVFRPERDGEFKVFDRFCSDDFISRTISFEIKPHSKLPGNATILKGVQKRIWVNEDQTISMTWPPYEYGEQNWNKAYLDIANTENTLQLKSTDALRTNQVNVVHITTDFNSRKAALYLNGVKQAEADMQTYLYLPWKSEIGHNLDASLDNFYVISHALSEAGVAQTVRTGYPAFTPSPSLKEAQVNRKPLLQWRTIDSISAIKDPTYEVYVGESMDSFELVGRTKEQEIEVDYALKPLKRYFWRVDQVSEDRRKGKRGSVWEFVTARNISENIIPEPNMAGSGKWHSQWPAPQHDSNRIAFWGHGHNVEQALNPEDLHAGSYRLLLHADNENDSDTCNMWFILRGKDASGNDTEFHREIVDLGNMQGGVANAYFTLEESLTDARSVVARLQLPDGVDGKRGHNSPFRVSTTRLKLLNNVDLSTLPNQAPRFAEAKVTLPNMPYEDNAYGFEFKPLVTDEKPEALKFRALEAPSWVTVQESGRVFSYHGAPKDALGKHRLKVEVIDSEGLADVLMAEINVTRPGEMSLIASEANLPKNKEIRLTGNRITHFNRDDASASWNFFPGKTDTYEIYLYAGTPNDNVGKVTLDGKSVNFDIKSTGSYGNIQPHKIGQFQLTKGKSLQLTLEAVKRIEGLCDISHIKLMPTGSEI